MCCIKNWAAKEIYSMEKSTSENSWFNLQFKVKVRDIKSEQKKAILNVRNDSKRYNHNREDIYKYKMTLWKGATSKTPQCLGNN